MRWQEKLTKKEMEHFEKVAGCQTLAQFKQSVATQRKWDAKNPDGPKACWECHFIAKKLGV